MAKDQQHLSRPGAQYEYANGISLWQHSIFKNWQRERDLSKQNLYGWLKAREEIQRRIEDDLNLKRRRTRTRVARFKEASEKTSVRRGAQEATLTMRDSAPNPLTYLTTKDRELEAATNGLKYPPVDDFEVSGLSFTAVYKKGYEVG